jgi:hypothetical protein
MKNIIISIAIIFIAISASAQSDKPKPKGFLALNAGLGLPIGNFAGTDFNKNDQGFAILGVNFHLANGIPLFNSHFGIATKIDFGINPVDDVALRLAFRNSINNPSYNYTAKSLSNYTYSTTLIGLFITLPTKRFSFDYRLQAGIMYAKTPTLNFIASNNTLIVNSTLYETNATAFAFNIGLGVRYSIVPKLCLLFNIDYLDASPTFTSKSVTKTSIPGSTDTETSYTTSKQNISLINASFGIGWQFGSKSNK